ncbi:MAG: bifunctional riboflavin kinase/FAD synthetase [Desulfobulbus sp.]|nr:bifunctional riboflavin kinase/FAD synthetase [Desulfobulbus sp.]
MEIFTDLNEIRTPFRRAHVTIGNFDGVHLGHQKLFDQVVARAHQNNGTSVAVTFDPHPLKVLSPHGIRLISTTAQKIELIRRAGIDVLVIIPFTAEVANTTAVEFVDEILLGRLGMCDLVVGYDYAMGKQRLGDTHFLQEQGKEKGFAVMVMPAHYEQGMLVSSSKIRELVAAGKMGDVRRLLGRYYQIRGIVQLGRQRGGAQLGFPTANLYLSEEDLCPKRGVYVTQVIYDGRQYGGVSNIGYNPTFGDTSLVAETHIFDFNRDIYGRPLKINLLRHLRNEVRFDGPDALIRQIRRDIEVARKVLLKEQQRRLIAYHDGSSATDAPGIGLR